MFTSTFVYQAVCRKHKGMDAGLFSGLALPTTLILSGSKNISHSFSCTCQQCPGLPGAGGSIDSQYYWMGETARHMQCCEYGLPHANLLLGGSKSSLTDHQTEAERYLSSPFKAKFTIPL